MVLADRGNRDSHQEPTNKPTNHTSGRRSSGGKPSNDERTNSNTPSDLSTLGANHSTFGAAYLFAPSAEH